MAVYLGSTKVGTTIVTSAAPQSAITATRYNFIFNKDYIFDITGIVQSQDIVITNDFEGSQTWQGDNVTITFSGLYSSSTVYLVIDTISDGSVALKFTGTKPQITPFVSFRCTTTYGEDNIFYRLSQPVVYRPTGNWTTSIYE